MESNIALGGEMKAFARDTNGYRAELISLIK